MTVANIYLLVLIAGLIGVTVYLVDGDRLLTRSRDVTQVDITSPASDEASRTFNVGASGGAENGLDYQEWTDGRARGRFFHRAKSPFNAGFS